MDDLTTYSHVHKHHHDQDCDQNLTQKDTIHLSYESYKYENNFLWQNMFWLKIKIHRKNYQLYRVSMLFSLSNMTCPSTVLHIKDFLVTYLILHSSQRMQRTLGPWQDRNPLNTWCRWLYNDPSLQYEIKPYTKCR